MSVVKITTKRDLDSFSLHVPITDHTALKTNLGTKDMNLKTRNDEEDWDY